MPAILPFLQLDTSSLLKKHFALHQIYWIEAEDHLHAQGKQVCALAEKSIRIGWTYADALKNVRKRLRFKNAITSSSPKIIPAPSNTCSNPGTSPNSSTSPAPSFPAAKNSSKSLASAISATTSSCFAAATSALAASPLNTGASQWNKPNPNNSKKPSAGNGPNALTSRPNSILIVIPIRNAATLT